ncbi:hypothetical protein J2Y74_004388 [Pseudomonas migulae]|nr:hypothetical protein [Pseudomonas migulae]
MTAYQSTEMLNVKPQSSERRPEPAHSYSGFVVFVKSVLKA